MTMNPLFQISGCSMLLVASVVFIDGLWVMGKVSKRPVIFVNLFASFIIFATSMFSIFSSQANIISIYAGVVTLLISCLYFWVALNIVFDIDNMIGLGWFSLIVAATLAVLLINPIPQESSLWYIWSYVNWAVWCGLFLLYFFLIILKAKIHKFIGYYAITASIVSAFLPGFLALMTNIK